MKEWKYNLKRGKDLIKAINEEDYKCVLETLLSCYLEILSYFQYKKIIDPEDFETEYNYYTENIQQMLKDEEYDEDEINYELSDFYDLCDNCEIWIPLI